MILVGVLSFPYMLTSVVYAYIREFNQFQLKSLVLLFWFQFPIEEEVLLETRH